MNNIIQIRLQLARDDFKLDINIDIPSEGVTVIFGPSGSGKTTLLRCIAGLERRAEGSLLFNEQRWQQANYFTPCYKRPIGYVFQEASLLEHLSVKGNLEYAVKRAPKSKGNTDTSISLEGVIKLLSLAPLLSRATKDLSGGERQRVAIARALLIQPDLLLMDEPLASLDDTIKRELMPYLLKIKNEMSLPIIYVTHSTDELLKLADHVMIIEQGKNKHFGQPEALFGQLQNSSNIDHETSVLLSGKVEEIDSTWALAKVVIGNDSLWIKSTDLALNQKIRLRIFARDVSLTLDKPEKTSILNTLSATVLDVNNGSDAGTTIISLSTMNTQLTALISARSAHTLDIRKDQKLWAQVKSVAIVC